jgi:hypothetical protein
LEFWDRRFVATLFDFHSHIAFINSSVGSFHNQKKVKVILHSLSNDPSSVQVECLDTGKYPHPTDCFKYIQCAKVHGYTQGFIFECGPGMSFQVGGMCSFSKLGCTRNNVRLMTS